MGVKKKIRGCSFLLFCFAILISIFHFIDFVDELQSKIRFPIYGSLLVLIVIAIFVISKVNKSHEDKKISDILWEGKPDNTSFIIRNSYLLALLILGIYIVSKANSNMIIIIGICILLFTVYLLIVQFVGFEKVKYIIDSNGVYISKLNLAFNERLNFINFKEIARVVVEEAFFERNKDIGTIVIFMNEEDNEGQPIYYKLIGIKKPYYVSKLIIRKVDDINC